MWSNEMWIIISFVKKYWGDNCKVLTSCALWTEKKMVTHMKTNVNESSTTRQPFRLFCFLKTYCRLALLSVSSNKVICIEEDDL